jgi:hypothetical protein
MAKLIYSAHTLADQPPFMRDFAKIWQAADKGRVLQDAGGGVQRQDADRAGLRPRAGPADESPSGT